MTGEYSEKPLARISSKYLRMLNDGNFLSNRAAVDMIDERILELADRIDEHNAPERVRNLYVTWQKFKRAREAGDTAKEMKFYLEMENIFDAVYHDYMSWSQMFEALEQRRKHVESEVKILKSINAMMTAEDAVELVGKVLAVILRVEDDPKKIKQYHYELNRLIGGLSPEETVEGFGDGGGEVIDA